MGQVIKVNFGAEREWEDTHATIVDGLVCIGSLFGDDEKLMRAKADCVYRLLRRMVDDVPSPQLAIKPPKNLLRAQVKSIRVALKEAELRGIEIALTHVAQAVMDSAYDLCTSRLAAPSRAG